MKDEDGIGYSVSTGRQIICQAHRNDYRVVVRSSELDLLNVTIAFEKNGKRAEIVISDLEARLLGKALTKYLETDGAK